MVLQEWLHGVKQRSAAIGDIIDDDDYLVIQLRKMTEGDRAGILLIQRNGDELDGKLPAGDLKKMSLDRPRNDAPAFPDTGQDQLPFAGIILQDLVGHA